MFSEIQNLRAIAILAVILIHVLAASYQVGSLTYVTGLALAIDSAAHFAVPLFICISGFVLTLKDYSLSTFYFRRGMAILPAYLLSSVIYAAYFNRPILQSIFTARASYHLPFFAMILVLYLLYPLIMRLYFGGITLLISLLIQANTYYGPYETWIKTLPIWLYLWTSTIFYFVLGIYACKNYAKFQAFFRTFPLIWLILPALALWSFISLQWLDSYYNVNYFESSFLKTVSTNPLITTAFYVIAFSFIYRIASCKSSQILKNIGDYSFGIYLVHVLILDLTCKVLLLHNVDTTDIVFYMLSFISTLVISYLIISCWYSVKRWTAFGRR